MEKTKHKGQKLSTHTGGGGQLTSPAEKRLGGDVIALQKIIQLLYKNNTKLAKNNTNNKKNNKKYQNCVKIRKNM